MPTIHAPDDDLDERWEAEHAHPALGDVPGFDTPELAERARANDVPPADPPPARSHARGSATTENTGEADVGDESNVYDHGAHGSETERMGHEMMIEEYENSLDEPTEIEIDGSPFV